MTEGANKDQRRYVPRAAGHDVDVAKLVRCGHFFEHPHDVRRAGKRMMVENDGHGTLPAFVRAYGAARLKETRGHV